MFPSKIGMLCVNNNINLQELQSKALLLQLICVFFLVTYIQDAYALRLREKREENTYGKKREKTKKT